MTTSAAAVRATIAHQCLPPDEPTTIGSIDLLPHQRDAVHRVRAALDSDHLALLADDVGMGKTYVALAVARHYATVHIIAPASLLGTWCTAMTRTATTHARLWSLHRFSRCEPPPLQITRRTLIIIDEAHHLRTAQTRRFRAIADAVSGSDVLLLSATPIHNSTRDLRTLLSLRLSSHQDTLSASVLTRLVVRRSGEDLQPSVQEHAPHPMPLNPAVLEAVLALPAPLPARDGAVAGALIRLGLLRAWCSSDAALAQALTQRLLRSEALRHALLAGRHPTRSELRTWLVGDQEVQLAFPELMTSQAPDDGNVLDVLERHIDALTALRQLHRTTMDGDTTRAATLRAIVQQYPHTPIVAFSQYAQTVRALARALMDIAGVGALTGRRAWIASGPITRAEALALFAPVAQGRAPPPAHQRIRLLITTDLLAEGVNLQDAGVVIHLDPPWTAALAHQRIGRCARIGTPHDTVHVHRLQVPEAMEAVARLEARLAHKQRLTTRVLGAALTAAHADPNAPRVTAIQAASALRDLLRTWQQEHGGHLHRPCTTPESQSATRGSAHAPCIAYALAPHRAWLAAVRDPQGTVHLIGGRQRSAIQTPTGWRVCTRADTLLPIVRMASHAADMPRRVRTSQRQMRARIARQLAAYRRRWTLQVSLHASLQVPEDAPRHAGLESMRDPRPPVWRQARARVLRTMHTRGAAHRASTRTAAYAALQMLETARGTAAEQALRMWLSRAAPEPSGGWLMAWREMPALARGAEVEAPAAPRSRQRWRTLAILILLRTGAGTGTGARTSFGT